MIRIYPDLESVSQAGARAFAEIGRAAISDTGRFTVVLAGGSTPRRLYECLAGAPFREALTWEKVEFFWGDERAVSTEHPDSNYKMANDAMLKYLDVPETHIHRMPAELSDLDAAARRYQNEILRTFDTLTDDEVPCFDLVVLGMGEDGHTASLFPHADVLHDTAHWVVPTQLPQSDSRRLTLTPTIINHARQIMFLVTGANKSETLARVVSGPYEPERLPAQLIRPMSDDLIWLIDEGAAAQLPDQLRQEAKVEMGA